MKKVLLAAVAVFAFGSASAQETKFGVKAGFGALTVTVPGVTFFGTTVGGGTASTSGFAIGGFARIGMSDKMSVQPELNFIKVSEAKVLSVPVLINYDIAEQFRVMAGPSLFYMMDQTEDKTKIAADLGAAYIINENMDVSAKYSLGFGENKVGGYFVSFGYTF